MKATRNSEITKTVERFLDSKISRVRMVGDGNDIICYCMTLDGAMSLGLSRRHNVWKVEVAGVTSECNLGI